MPSRPVDLLVIHCSATANGDGLFRGTSGQPGFLDPADVIDGWHAARGFRRTGPAARTFNPRHQAIGYHYVISCNGAIFSGRHLDEVGAHAAGHNSRSIGICLTGTDRYTGEQWTQLDALVRELCRTTGIPLQPAERDSSGAVRNGLCGHRDLSPDLNRDGVIQPREWTKRCPGFDVADWLRRGRIPQRDNLILDNNGAA